MSPINIFLFFIGISRVVDFDVGGRLFIADLVFTASFFLLIGKVLKYLRNGPVLLIVSLAALWLLNQIITDVYLGTPFEDWSRGWAKIVFFVLDFLGLLVLTELKFPRISAFMLGTAFSFLIEPNFFPKPYYFDFENAWKFAYGPALTTLAALLGTSIFVRRLFGAMSEWLPLALLGIANLAMDFRSFFGIAMAAVAFRLVKGAIDMLRVRITPALFVVLLGVGLVFSNGMIGLYSIAADNGWLGPDARDKYLAQTSGSVSLLATGRSEWLISTRAIEDSPIIGHGSWVKDAEYISLYMNLLESRGIELIGDYYESLLIPTHSHLFGAWVEAGIMGAAFWFAMLGIAFKALYVTLKSKSEKNHATFLALILFWFIWDVMFSPFGAEQRMMKAVEICIALMMLERPRSNADFDTSATIRKNSVATL